MYKPNFCADCGERITRSRWRFWTSRSFCPNCEGRFRRARLLWPLMTAAALFSVGLMMGRATRTQPAPLTIERRELPAVEAKDVNDPADADAEARADSASSSVPEPQYGPSGTATERPTDPQEVISLCGARTQKGTPCRRRVRGSGRCWQHKVLR